MGENLIIFLCLSLLLYFASRFTIGEIFSVINRFTNQRAIIYPFFALIFFPGTVIHELAHYFVGTMLLIKIREVKIFPEWQDNHLKLGSVSFEKKDFIRGIIVGVAPFIIGLLFFLWLSILNIFPNKNLLMNILFIYLIFTVSTMMFSSQADLIELINIIPLIILILLIIYIFNLRVDYFIANNNWIKEGIIKSLSYINYYLLFSLIINLIIIILLKSLRRIFHR